MKRTIFAIMLLAAMASAAAADDLTGELQWLSVQTACLGMYNNAQAGNYTLGDPQDYYKPSDIREYLTERSGSRTVTQTFYGICFDYAQSAYDEIKNNRNRYESLGMKQNGWYIAVVKDNPRQILLYDPVSQDKATDILNGVYLKENSRQNMRNHGGTTTWHAWLWVYGNDGTIYWIDPTWTDNAGYVCWGIVRNGEEVSQYPDTSLCMVPINSGDPSFAAFNRGNANKNKSNWDQAILEYNEALRVNPNNAAVYNSRGIAYYEKEDYDRAIADYNQAIRLDPNYASAYNSRGVAYIGKYEAAYYNSGYTYYDKEALDKAIADFNQAIRLDPNYASAYNNRGIAYSDRGDRDMELADYDKAMADYNQAIRLNPNSTAAYYNRGGMYEQKFDYDRAIADFTQVIRLDSNYIDAYTKRGHAYLMKDDYDRARADWSKALELDPNNTYARNMLREY
jgi:tetratricopeptide (TPR) repeat protein